MRAAAGRRPLLRPGWIVFALFALNPLWWVLGFGDLTWSLAAVPLVVWLLTRPGRLQPLPTLSIFAIYLCWSAVTVVRLDRFTRYLSFGFRLTATITALGLALYVFHERRVTRSTFIRWISWYWVAAIIGGYVAFVLPGATLQPTLASLVLPGSITSNDLVQQMVRPGFAQVQNLFGVAIPRPKTLFPFTNEWGGNVGLLTPFFVISFIYSQQRRERIFGIVMIVIAIPPMVVSLNRGLWISLAITGAIVSVRSYRQGRTAALKVVMGAIVLVAVLLVVTPLGTIIAGRLGESDAETRAELYTEAWEGAKQSPILGFGGPRPSANPFSPSVGTHGHFWLVMFSYGFVGLALYLWWVGAAIRAALKPRDEVSILLGCVVVVGGVQMMFYNLLPHALPIVLTAFGLMCRPPDHDERDHQPLVPVGRRRELAHA